MADSQDVQFKLDLDNSDFMGSANEALSALQEVGDPENISGLISTLGSIGLALGSVAVAAFAFKEAIDLSEEAETIQRTQDEFQALTAQAGISASALQEGMEKASLGLIDTNTLLGDANQAIVKMGSSAAQLPEIMTLATKAVAVFGGDLNSVFNGMVTSIGNGNTRMLKQYGIVVDSTKAVQDYAKANDLAENEISAFGKSQAIMNAVLEQGNARFAGVQGGLTQTATSVKQFEVTLTELKDTFLLVFEKTIGPSLHSFLNTVNGVAQQAKTALTAMFGDGLKQNQAQITGVEASLAKLKAQLATLQSDNSDQGFLSKLWSGDKSEQIAKISHEIAQTTATLNVLKQTNSQLEEQDQESEATKQELMATGQKDASQDVVNQQKRLANKTKFTQELTQMDAAYYKDSEKNINTLQQIEVIADQQLINLKQQNAAKIAAINKDEALNATQKASLIHLQEATFTQQTIANDRQVAALRVQLLNDYVANSKSAFEGIERAAQQMTLQAKAELQDFGKQGQEVMNAFKQNSVSAFQNMGAAMAQGTSIAKATTDAIKQLFLGMIGDIANQDGTRIMLSGVWPPNPLALGAGAALIAFGGALKSLAGSAATTTSTGAVSTSSGTVSATNNGVTTTQTNNPSGVASPTAAAATNATPQRAVSINIAGNYFNTAQTQQALMEMIRSETDATSFQYNSIGV